EYAPGDLDGLDAPEHVKEALYQRGRRVAIQLPSQAFTEPKTDADWNKLLTYFVDKITLDGPKGVEPTLHYDGVLGRPFPLAQDADGSLVEIESQRP
ncbi:MAG: hypothetical protein ACRDP3_22795, partial [Streptomyces sp.]|uniref:hypothetical protein n=1 Tax=Streptomyces sp. TaxID=1931 RepID=UPI003D6A72F8